VSVCLSMRGLLSCVFVSLTCICIVLSIGCNEPTVISLQALVRERCLFLPACLPARMSFRWDLSQCRLSEAFPDVSSVQLCKLRKAKLPAGIAYPYSFLRILLFPVISDVDSVTGSGVSDVDAQARRQADVNKRLKGGHRETTDDM